MFHTSEHYNYSKKKKSQHVMIKNMKVAVNLRPPQLLVDPNIDLASVIWPPYPATAPFIKCVNMFHCLHNQRYCLHIILSYDFNCSSLDESRTATLNVLLDRLREMLSISKIPGASTKCMKITRTCRYLLHIVKFGCSANFDQYIAP